MRQSLIAVFDKAVSSWFDNASEEHGLTEDGKTVAPIFVAFCSKSRSPAADSACRLQVVSSKLTEALLQNIIRQPFFQT